MDRIEAYDGDTNGLIKKFQEFFADSWRELFRIAVVYLWLEKQITYNGKRRLRRYKNGHVPDQTFGRFMAQEVGIDQAMLTRSRWFNAASYFMADYMKDFLDHDPYEEPEYFSWPFEHVTIDFYSYIYQVETRKELLAHAEENDMTFLDFKNWVNNYVLSYNEEQGEDIYSIGRSRDGTTFIRHKDWEKFPLDALYESTKEAQTGNN